ncbi:hypothetical protein TWF694_001990 [Orbilia ellipsospora]|uniref:Uncharacterized protein n=1 Tax=Orbilia ellipsospora TaxID=2528407 RepID=A0AAV9X4J2_9PEZI
MLVLLFAYYAALAAADGDDSRHPPPLPLRYTIDAYKGTPPRTFTGIPRNHRRQAANSAGEGMGMLQPADIDALMDAKYFQPGKLPVKYAYTSVTKDMLASAWIATANVTGNEYDFVIDNMLSDTWLYGPLDPNKCWMEGLTHYMGKDFCYQNNMNGQDPMNVAHYINNTHPFFNNFTSYGDLGYSGMRAILNNISSSIIESPAASWPAIIELADNVYNPVDGSSPSAGDRRYNGVLGLAKKDMSGQDIMVDNLSGGSPIQYSGSPFSAKSGWTYFTSYFNAMNEPENLYLGLQYTDTTAYTGDLVTVATSAGSSEWEFDANPSWQVSYQATNNVTGATPGTIVKMPFPLANLSATNNIKLGLSSAITYLDLETAHAIYSQFGGGCLRESEYMRMQGYGHMNHTKGDWNMTEHGDHWNKTEHEGAWNGTEGHNKTFMHDHDEHEYPWCRLPVTVNYNKDTDDQWTTVTADPQLTLPWGPNFDIKIDAESLIGDVKGRPCTGPNSRPKNDAASCQMHAYGTIQPNIIMDKHGKRSASFWVYGGIVFQNAFLKWDTANNGAVSAAAYAKKTDNSHESGVPSPGVNRIKSKPQGKPRVIRFPDGVY